MKNEFIRQEEVNARLQFRHMIAGMWPFARRYPWLLAASIGTLLLTIVASRLMPQTIGYVVDHGILPKDASVLWTCAWVYLGLEIVHATSEFFYQFLFQKFGNRVLADLREALMQHTQSLPLDYFHRNPVGRIVTRLTNDPSNLSDIFSEGLVAIATNVLIVISIIVSMILISWKLTLITLALLPLFLWAAFRVNDRNRIIQRESKKKLSALNAFASENLQGMRTLQALSAVPQTKTRFGIFSEEYRQLLLRGIKAQALLQPIMNLFTAVVVSAALAGGGFLALDNSLAIGSLVAFLLHAQDFTTPLREILDKYQQFQNSLTSAERVFHLFDEKPEPATAIEDESDSARIANFRGGLKIHDLWFRYEDSHPWVFEGLDLEIKPGEKAALVGRTGAGKSTLISLLQRFYEAPPRRIFLDGVAIEDIPRARLRRSLGVVQQDPVLFRGTIAQNLALGEDVPREKMENALREIGARDLLKKSGRDLDSWVEERGANLSLGERQLLCFARILVFDPHFLILDEATANIDSETEALIQRAVERITADRTSLIIAHRLSTLRHCNRFFEIKSGKSTVSDQLPV